MEEGRKNTIGLLEQAAFAFAESNLTGGEDVQTFTNGEIGSPASLPCGHDHLRGIGSRSSCGTEDERMRRK